MGIGVPGACSAPARARLRTSRTRSGSQLDAIGLLTLGALGLLSQPLIPYLLTFGLSKRNIGNPLRALPYYLLVAKSPDYWKILNYHSLELELKGLLPRA
jgi:hypothetical protein